MGLTPLGVQPLKPDEDISKYATYEPCYAENVYKTGKGNYKWRETKARRKWGYFTSQYTVVCAKKKKDAVKKFRKYLDEKYGPDWGN